MKKQFITGFFMLAAFIATAQQKTKPNIVIIYADDLGYGDISANGATKIKTPNIDKLAKQGLRFTNAHAAAATCTPSRYALLTGQYAWRKKGTGIAPGNAPLILDPEKNTISDLLKKAGYNNAVVGKWHLGLGPAEGADWNGEIKPGPLELGFDYSFILPATGDRVPSVYVENHRIANLDPADPIKVSYTGKIGNEPTGLENPELLTKQKPSHGHNQAIVNGISRIGYQTGGVKAYWNDEDMAAELATRAKQFIVKNKQQPFFLYLATHDIHVPRVPHSKFLGKSGLGLRGDAILQLDWTAGEIIRTLDSLKISDNTIVIFSSDNGPVIDDGYIDEAAEKLNGHTPSGPLRGGKYSAFEAGTRVPFIVKWPKGIKPGTSDALISQVDLFASFAALTGQQLEATDAPDSQNVLDALLGKSPSGRKSLVEQAATLSIIKGNWKYIEPKDGVKILKGPKTESGFDPEPQLYDLKKDPGERVNVAKQNPETVQELADELNEIREKGTSR